MSETLDSTQPNPAGKPRRRFPWMNLLIFILIVALGLLGGYGLGSGDRMKTQATVVGAQVKEQFDLAVADLDAGNYESAKSRFDFILRTDPNYPGLQEKIQELVLKMSITPTLTFTPTPTLTPTPDTRAADAIFNEAQGKLQAKDWGGTVQLLDVLRKNEPTYRAAEIDGMYYLALRNQGVENIQGGSLEPGIYSLTLAERFGPLDGTADGLRAGARLYLIGASYWEVDWEQAYNNFSQVYNLYPNLWDSSSGMTATVRFGIAAMRMGDASAGNKKYCKAVEYYQQADATGVLSSEPTSQTMFEHAYEKCYPPTATPEEPVATEPPVVDTPTP
jgi:tetratricopeptide (TPR) repeat protein